MQVNGELRQWHKITLDFVGPSVKETASTFRDYRPDVTFVHAKTGTKMTVPGWWGSPNNPSSFDVSSWRRGRSSSSTCRRRASTCTSSCRRPRTTNC